MWVRGVFKRAANTVSKCVGRRRRGVSGFLVITAVLAVAIAAIVTGAGTTRAVAAQPPGKASVGVGGHVARHLAADSLSGCFGSSIPDCTSTDPDVSFDLVSIGDTSGCTFDGEVNWGDGANTSTPFAGGADSSVLVVFDHTYSEPGTYAIGWSAPVTSGTTCSSNSGTLSFTLAQAATTAEQGGAVNPSENSTDCYELAPVNCASGVFWHEFTDAQVPGRGVPLDFTRTYVSNQAASDGPFGFGWTDGYAASLTAGASGAVTITQENGSVVTFQADGSGGYIAPARVLATLAKHADGSFAFVRVRSQITYTFSAAGKLISETDLNGYSTTLGYDGGGQLTSVTDPAGRKLTLGYSGAHVVKLTDPMGRAWLYAYDSSGNLAQTTDPMGRAWSFTYNSDHLLLAMKDPRGGSTTSVYNASGQVVSQTDPVGGKTTWSYSGDAASPSGGVTTMTDASGHVTVYDYASLQLTSETRAAGTSVAATTTYAYDPATLAITSVTDPNGGITTSTYDSDGNLLTRTDPLGLTTTYTYNSLGEILTRQTPLGETTRYVYDGHGNVESVTDPIGSVTAYAYADPAHPGDVTSVTDPDGHVTTYSYDPAGNVITRSLSPSSGTSNTTLYAYDADGERLCLVDPKNAAAHVTCPSTGSAPGRGTTATTFDADGEITSSTDPNGSSTSFSYDGDGNKVKATNALGQVTGYAYNGNGQQTTTSRPDGTTLTSKYDVVGNLISQTDAAGHVTHYSYDAQGRRESVTDPLGRVTKFGYDLAGNLTSVTDPAGRITTYAYNGDNQQTQITYSDGITPDVAFTYDADGRRSSTRDGTGTTTYAFDADGRLVTVTNGAGAVVGYGYDAAGLPTSLTYPGGNVVERAYDGAGELTSVSDWLGNDTRFAYDAAGNVTGETYPNGVQAALGYDAAGHLTSLTDKTASATLASFGYAQDKLGRVTSVSQGGQFSGTQSYSYTQLGQLASDNSGSYGYDQAGNLTKLPGGTTQSFDAAGEMTASQVTPPAPATDQVVSANESSKAGAIISPGVTTKTTGELVVTLIAADGPKGKKQQIISLTGGNLKWSLVTRSDARQGTAEIWQARSSGKLAGVKITATLKYKGYDGAVTVATFTGAGPVGAASAGNAARGAPAVSLKTTGAQSVVWAVGTDWQHATARTPARAQALVNQFLDGKTTSSYWAQRTAAIPGAATTVKVADTAPTGDGWELAAIEVTSADRATASQISYGYDSRGNQVAVHPSGGTPTTLTYDQANRLDAYGASVTDGYNGDGLRMTESAGTSTAQFAWDQQGSLPLLLTAGPVSYVYGPGGQPIEQITGGSVTYLQDDRQGSTRLLTDSSGAVVGSYAYTSFGKVANHAGTASTALQYGGQYSDPATSLQYLRARYYNPASGQFITEDPLTEQTQDPYLYTAGNPVNSADPSGLCQWWNLVCWFTSSPPSTPSSPCDWMLVPGSGGITGGGSGSTAGGDVYPNFQDPTQSPGPGWEWRGNGPVGSNQGSWYNPQTQQSLHPDLNHGGEIGPHYDYSGPDTWKTTEGKIRLYEGQPVPRLGPPAVSEPPVVPEEPILPEFPDFPDIPLL